MKYSDLKCYNVTLILVIRIIQQNSVGSFNHKFIDEKTNYINCFDKHIDLRKYGLLLSSDIALIWKKTTFLRMFI